ncbi:MAG: hypothetical protein H7101_01275, partial [Deinococcales bacterium]|nr:hypothetical protein [Chitinophagaceae bacterium]
MIQKFFILLLLVPSLIFAHGGEDHGDAKKETSKFSTYFSSETASDVYEVLVKYPPLQPGKPSVLKLFISDFNTNTPLDSANLQISVASNPNIKLNIRRIDKGLYEVSGIFSEKKTYNLTININSKLGPDLLLISNIEVGKELEKPAAIDLHAISHWYTSNWFFGIIGLLLGLFLMFFIMKKTNRKVAVSIIILFCLLPTATYNIATAHNGEEHGGGDKTGGYLSNNLIIEKETQFLFGILTQKIQTGNLSQS